MYNMKGTYYYKQIHLVVFCPPNGMLWIGCLLKYIAINLRTI